MRTPPIYLLSGLALIVVSSNSAFAAVTITTATGTNGADSYVHAGTATTNYGTSNIAAVKWAGSGNTTNRFVYLRFDLTGQTIDLSPVATLTLTSFNSNGNATFEVFGLNDGDAGESWGETTLIWNNRPAPGGGNDNTIGASATSLGTFAFNGSADGAVSTFSSTSLDNFLLADTNDMVTFIIRRTNSSLSLNSGIATKENTSFAAPSLTFVPEPSVALLGGLGLLGLLRRRRN